MLVFFWKTDSTLTSKYISYKTLTNIRSSKKANVEPEKREQVIDVVFDILNTTDAQTMKDIKANWFSNARTMMASYKNIDNETKDMIWKAVGELLKSAKNNIFEDFPKLPEKEQKRMLIYIVSSKGFSII